MSLIKNLELVLICSSNSEGNNCEKGIIIRREFWSINDFILQNWEACVDTIFGHESGKLMKLGSVAREVMSGR